MNAVGEGQALRRPGLLQAQPELAVTLELRAENRMLRGKMGQREEEGRRGECSRKWEHCGQSPETVGTLAHSRN